MLLSGDDHFLVLELVVEVADFVHSLVIALVDRGLLPPGKHNDEVEFRESIRTHPVSLRLSERRYQVVLFVFASLMHEFQIGNLVSDYGVHVLV